MLFSDRHDAGRQLAQQLLAFKDKQPVVLALPRGGVPIGFEIARALAAPLDLVQVRKIGAPGEDELAVGAIAEGDPPELVTDARLLARLNVPLSYVENAKSAALKEIGRRRSLYLGSRRPVDIAGRTAIVVDDGIATGSTMRAALRVARQRQPICLILAVPVAASRSLKGLRREADQTVCLHVPANFLAVGQFYRHFPQMRDDEVMELLDRARVFAAEAHGREATRSAG